VGRDVVTADPAAALRAILDAARVERVLYAVTVLGIPDLLAEGPRDVETLASATGTQGTLLGRVLRLLVAAGVLDEPTPEQFGLTAVGHLLRTEAPGSLRTFLLYRGEPWKRLPWDGLVEMLRGGATAFAQALGAPFFDYLAAHPEAGALFDAAMTGLTRGMLGIVPTHYDFARIQTVVDVGGGEGELLLDILRHHPHLRGVLVDQPQVVGRAAARIEAAGLADRCTAVSGDFFAAVPAGGDVYLMKMILHDWDDERARTILDVCRAAMDPDSRLLLVERVLPPAPPYPLEPFLLDLTMMLELGSQERTEAQWRELLASAGFDLARVIPTSTPMSLIEAQPARSERG
jgi:hypothetical protein